MIGKKFGRWTVVCIPPNQNIKPSKRKATCLCDCGTTRDVRVDGLLNGRSSSCGCFQREELVRRSSVHGMYQTSEYEAWRSMRQRISNSKRKGYDNYGGRGIKICDRWLESFENFYEDMGPKPSKSHSVEREDVNGNYEPSNCKWATWKEQANNKRDTSFLTVGPFRMRVNEWSEVMNVEYNTILTRLRRGWTPHRAVKARPIKKKIKTKTSEKTAIAIVDMLKDGSDVNSIIKKTNASYFVIYNIKNNRTWKHLPR